MTLSQFKSNPMFDDIALASKNLLSELRKTTEDGAFTIGLGRLADGEQALFVYWKRRPRAQDKALTVYAGFPVAHRFVGKGKA